MWPFLCMAATAAAFGIFFVWRRKCAAAQAEVEKIRAESARVAEEQRALLEQAEARQAAFFDSMIEGILALDGEGRIQAANQALRWFFGIEGEPRGKTLMEVFRLHELSELRERALREGKVRDFDLELEGLRKRSFEVTASTLPTANGAAPGVVFVFHDVTRLKHLENTRKEFVANVSHELRTPLTMIKGFVETLMSGGSEDPDLTQRFLRTIDKHTDRLTFLIEDLLTISRLESGQIVLNSQPLVLRDVVDQVMDNLRVRAEERQVHLINDVSEQTEIFGDGDRLQQVFANLIDNAIKYGGKEGTVEVGAAEVDGETRVWVRDDGPGIPPESLQRVFERFYRVDRARSRDQGGTGLGLAIVKHIVQSHGGEAWAENASSGGAVFYFTLPHSAPTRADAPGAE